MKSTRISVSESLKTVIKETKVISKILELGTTCLNCFENDPFVIEGHHWGGKNNSSIIIPLCANCHLRASKNQLSYDNLCNKRNKPDALKLLYVLKDLQFLEDQIMQMIINELGTD